MKNKGILAVVSGFSGAGKGTLMKALLQNYDNYALSISATTRSPREGEADGREYFFLTEEAFEEKIRNNELIEYARYVNHYYGTPRDYVEQKMAEGKDVILEIEIQGALKVKEQYPDAILLFVMPPNALTLKNRLTGRGTETEEVIDARLKRAADEAEGIEAYDYILINDDLDACVEQMHCLIQGQHCRVSQNLELIQQMRSQLKEL
ncbi:MAG TPA: guanylate kinase [Candidatus Lachnoclostridium stercoravium]|uniref:Guanylate kinase n=1 Tax=Candidatus Lachnoclostridium stercoravium TaxID=2838633 RepID=A0A9D2KMD5_9FIRM|nr:guanylate kinase [Candidatus Lachnoclostridium stercoravium]